MRLRAPRVALLVTSVTGAVVATAFAVMSATGSTSTASPVAAKAAATDPSAAAVTNTVTQSAAQVQAYWTASRLRSARDLTNTEVTSARTATTTALRSVEASGETLVGDPTTPTGPVTTAADSAAARKAFPKNPKAKIWTKHGTAPARTIGKLFFTKKSGGNFSCSATVITAKNKSTVWTAGHCVYDGGKTNATHQNFLFRPDYVDGKSRGSWTVHWVSTTQGWIKNADSAYDIGALVTNKLGGKTLQSVTGSQGYKFNQSRNWNVYDFGYPGDLLPSGTKISSNKLRYCSGPTVRASYGTGKPIGYALHCTMGHGASGGPWLAEISKGLGRIVGINSTHSLKNDYMFSPFLGTAAINVYNYAAAH
ncbi:MAG: hypothetical protein JWN52_1940 [Actinomycetia bacterium]|nr:hypothetical protein [Actinomycetes bacterium]